MDDDVEYTATFMGPPDLDTTDLIQKCMPLGTYDWDIEEN